MVNFSVIIPRALSARAWSGSASGTGCIIFVQHARKCEVAKARLRESGIIGFHSPLRSDGWCRGRTTCYAYFPYSFLEAMQLSQKLKLSGPPGPTTRAPCLPRSASLTAQILAARAWMSFLGRTRRPPMFRGCRLGRPSEASLYDLRRRRRRRRWPRLPSEVEAEAVWPSSQRPSLLINWKKER